MRLKVVAAGVTGLAHLQGVFFDANNFAKRLKTLKGLTPFEYIAKCWATEPKRFTENPFHHSAGLNS